MKKSILMLAIMAISISAIAQSKSDTGKAKKADTVAKKVVKPKPQFSYDLNRKINVHIEVNFTAETLYDYYQVANGFNPDMHQDISAYQATVMKTHYKMVVDSLQKSAIRAFGTDIKTAQKNFADTAGKPKDETLTALPLKAAKGKKSGGKTISYNINHVDTLNQH